MLFISPVITVYIVFITILVGLCMGSFLNCFAWRMTHGESVFKGRSHCALCGHELKLADLFPVFSFILLRGRCRYCGSKISPRYLLVELATAVLFVAIVLKFDVSWLSLQYLILISVLLALTLCDMDSFIIPDGLIIAGIINFLVFSIFLSPDIWQTILDGLIGALALSVPIFLLSLIADRILKKESLGGGDIKLLFMLGLYFDWKCGLLLLILACFLGLIFALIYNKIAVNEDPENPTAFPFGFSISLAAFVVLMCGNSVVSWYLNLFSLL